MLQTMQGFVGGREEDKKEKDRLMLGGGGGVKTVIRRLNASFEREVLLFKIPILHN